MKCKKRGNIKRGVKIEGEIRKICEMMRREGKRRERERERGVDIRGVSRSTRIKGGKT